MSDEPNIYELRADVRHHDDRLTHLEEEHAEANAYREKQIELLARISAKLEDLPELKVGMKRLYIFCAVIAGSISGGVEVAKHAFF